MGNSEIKVYFQISVNFAQRPDRCFVLFFYSLFHLANLQWKSFSIGLNIFMDAITNQLTFNCDKTRRQWLLNGFAFAAVAALSELDGTFF